MNATQPIKLMLLGLLLLLIGVSLLPLINEVFFFVAPYLGSQIARYAIDIPISILGGIVAIVGVVVALVGFFSRAKPA